jgi:HK97 family phage portal protein
MLEKLKALFAPERKHSATAPLIALHEAGRARWTPRNYAAMAREGFQGNAVGYRCVRMIAEAAATVPFLLFEGNRERDEHPMLELLGRPNPAMTGRELLESVYGFLQLSGNAYVEAVSVEGAVRELHVLRPDRMRAVAGANGWAESYEYAVNGQSIRLPREAVLHARLFHPLDDYYGLSPLEAAGRAIDTHNSASAWNKAMLDNAARPSGALVFKGASGDGLTDEQHERLKQELKANYQGPINAGRPLVLEGGLDWKPMSYTPRDMEFNEAKNMAARDVALAFGVPPMLLGIPGDNTYSNYAEANRVFWRQTALPLAARMAEALSGWLAPMFGDGLRLEIDPDRVEALSPEREALWARVGAASFLTDDEKRAAVGYGALSPSAIEQGSS